MIRLIAQLLALAALAGAADLTVLSFNVRYPNPKDGDNRWEVRRDLLVDTIRASDPDLIGTQELFKLQGDYIVEKLPPYAWFGLGRRGDSEDEHMGVFYRKPRLKLIDSGHHWLSETPDKPGSMSWNINLARMLTWGLFEDLKDQRRFYFLNTHLPHRGQDEEARTQCARVIAAWMAKLPPQFPVILSGDFNTGVTSEAYRTLTDRLKDARSGLSDPAGEIGTFHGFTGKPGRERIDWILYRGFTPRRFRTITSNQDSRYPSDHFPVEAVLGW